MSQDMYDFINNHMSEFNIDEENGLIITPKGTHGTVCTSTGYLRMKHKGKTLQVHQVLAVKYFGSLYIGMQINHIDGNKMNNKRTNLEPITQADNIRHQFENDLDGSKKSIMQFDMNGNHLKTFPSIKMASEEVGLNYNTIYSALKGYRIREKGRKAPVTHAGGYKWKYAK